MMEPEWLTAPLERLIAPTTTEEFFASIYERKDLACLREAPERFSDLLSIRKLDSLLSSKEFSTLSLGMARSEPPISKSFYTFKNGSIDKGAVLNHYQSGATLIFNQLHRNDAELARFCRALESTFSLRVQANVYLTPPESQGFGTHYDDHDVFILQISGSKRWRFFQKPIENPYKGEKFQHGLHKPSSESRECILNAGDSVYIPRGLMHEAENYGDHPSLHVTVGLLSKTWADLMLEAMSEVALRNSEFRKSLPPGFTKGNFQKDDAEQIFRELVAKFKDEADFEKVFDLFRDSFTRSTSIDISDGLALASASMKNTDKFILKSSTPAIIKTDEDKVAIICPGGDVHFDLAFHDCLKIALSGDSFSASDLGTEHTAEAIKVIRKLVSFGLIRGVNQ